MIGLLLMVRINYQHRLIMNRRRIPCLDGYLDRVNLVLWPRFKVCGPALDAQHLPAQARRHAQLNTDACIPFLRLDLQHLVC